MSTPASIAENRFGLGARPDSPPPADPRGWLKDQLARFDPRPPLIAAAGDSGTVVRQFADYRQRVAEMKKEGTEKPAQEADTSFLREGYITQATARISTAVTSPTPFAERLVHFWANHFAVSIDKQVTRALAGPLEFEAIRPNLGQSFLEMWLAVMRHPAMLLYLDQAQSIGPDSRAAQLAALRGRTLGLNENLAREAMELHSLGVRTGYAQADVTELARALTGWTVGGFARGPAARLFRDSPPGQFQFVELLHEPGDRTVLGRRYPDRGEGQARAILSDLAARPETARHIATKLARHFIADDPPPAAVTRLAAVFQSSGGSLPALHAALVDSPEAWAPGPGKFKTPWDWGVSAIRAIGAPGADQKAVGALTELGQPVWRPGSPAGWADDTVSWAGPDALLRRVELANRLGQLAPPSLDARKLAGRLLGDVSPQTAKVIASAANPGQGIALLLVSPEFQRR